MLALETTRRLVREVRDLPAVSRAGLLLMVAAGVLDVIVHLVSVNHAGHHGFSGEHAVHLLGIVGMVLVLAGVVIFGARRQLRHAAAKPGGLDPNAHR
jgi:uncharacterized protein YjeT (DUF2065 family)